jgi:hypothetical protein
MNWETALEGAVFSLPAVAVHPLARHLLPVNEAKGICRNASINL